MCATKASDTSKVECATVENRNLSLMFIDVEFNLMNYQYWDTVLCSKFKFLL